MATPPQSTNPKPLNPLAPPFEPPKIPETQPNLLPNFFVLPNETFQQPLQTPVEQAMTRRFLHLPVVTYHPTPVWSSYHYKVESYDAYSFLQRDFTPYFMTGVDENVRCKTGPPEVNVSANEYGFLECNENRNTARIKKRFISRWWRGPKKGTSRKWAPKLGLRSDDCDLHSVRSPPSDHDLRLVCVDILMVLFDYLVVVDVSRRHDLLRILDLHCREENSQAKLRSDPCRSEYDFVYLPMDFGFRANLGYAFVNFTTPVAAVRFSTAFHQHEWLGQVPGVSRKKICEITCAFIQGKGALKNHFERSKFPCHTNGYLPVVLSPPRDGSNRSRPTLVGRRTGVAAPPPVNRRNFLLRMAKKERSD
ncbi:protein terminal ear1 homolog [Pistacia vera]|uniref:protein terminal ear1 homolog n=1 Tax=Pistacia vera TaxID=55513 RepID=UPI001263D796|nr:protein terminal ear1 homolog [Pistacia vera]